MRRAGFMIVGVFEVALNAVNGIILVGLICESMNVCD